MARVVGALAQEQGAEARSDECEWTRLVGGSSLGELVAERPERQSATFRHGGDLAVVNNNLIELRERGGE